jgi:hypothetical protein
MAVSAISANQASYYTNIAYTGSQRASAASTASGGDSFEASAASGGGGTTSSTCPRSNSTCIGCGSCETSSTEAAAGGSGSTQAVSYETLQALSAYESASKYF